MHELQCIIIFKVVFKALVTCKSARGADKVFHLKGIVSFGPIISLYTKSIMLLGIYVLGWIIIVEYLVIGV